MSLNPEWFYIYIYMYVVETFFVSASSAELATLRKELEQVRATSVPRHQHDKLQSDVEQLQVGRDTHLG